MFLTVTAVAAFLSSCAPQAFVMTSEMRMPSKSGLDLGGKSMAVAYLYGEDPRDTLFNNALANGFASRLEDDYFGGSSLIELFKLPRTLGKFEGLTVTVGAGRFGPYVLHNKKYVSLPKEEDPMTISLETAIELIIKKREQEKERHIKTFAEDAKLEVLNGRYGPYIAYDGKNYRMPKDKHEHAAELTFEECMDIVNNAPEPKPARRKRK